MTFSHFTTTKNGANTTTTDKIFEKTLVFM